MKALVVYWSGTGNTESMAEKIASDLGCDVKSVTDVSVSDLKEFDTVILGCPAMGAEELEEDEFKPFYDEFIANSDNKRIALFGSYGWGDGEWMRTWEEDVKNNGGNFVASIIANGDASEMDDSEYQEFLNSLKS
jgi:flavodoxin short chain